MPDIPKITKAAKRVAEAQSWLGRVRSDAGQGIPGQGQRICRTGVAASCLRIRPAAEELATSKPRLSVLAVTSARASAATTQTLSCTWPGCLGLGQRTKPPAKRE